MKEVQKVLETTRKTGYTTVLKFMQIMVEKGLVSRDESTFAHVYQARIPQEQTQRTLSCRFAGTRVRRLHKQAGVAGIGREKGYSGGVVRDPQNIEEARARCGMTFETLLINPAVQSLGWALLHFVWQGALLAALLLVANALTRRSQARLRYAIGCIVMLLMPVVFVATILPRASCSSRRLPPQAAGVVAVSSADAAPAEGAVPTSGGTVLPRSDASAWYITAVLPGWVVCLWLVGVVGLSMYTAGGWLRVQQLRRRGIEPADPAWVSMLESLMRRLRVSRPVRPVQRPPSRKCRR